MPRNWKCLHCGHWTTKRSWICSPWMCTGKHRVCSSKCRQTCKIDRTLVPMSPEEIQAELAKRFTSDFLEEVQSQASSQESDLAESLSFLEESEEMAIQEEEKGKCEKVSKIIDTPHSPQKKTLLNEVTYSKLLNAGDTTQVLDGQEKASKNGRSIWKKHDIPKNSYSIIPTLDWIEALEAKTCGVENCTGSLTFLKYWTEGFFELVGLQCNDCSSVMFAYNSPPKKLGTKGSSGFRMINVEAVAAHLFAGKTLTSYLKETNMNEFIKPIGNGSWQRIEDFLWKRVEEVAIKKNAALAKELKERPILILSGDGAWAHRRNSGQGVYSVLDALTGKCVFRHVMTKSRHFQKKAEWGSDVWRTACEGNHSATSHSMEVIGFLHFVDWMRDNDLVAKWKIFIHDQDGKIGSLFREKLLPELKDVTLLHDPGHIRKNFKKKLTGVFGETSKYKSFAGRISRMWMRCVKSAEEKALASWVKHAKQDNIDPSIVTADSVRWKMIETETIFLDLWQHILPHYTRAVCPPSCPCNYLPYLVNSTNITGTENGGLFSMLPMEMLVSIFQYVNDPKTLAALIMTCKFMLTTLTESRKAIKVKPKSRTWLDVNNKKDKKKYDKLVPVIADMNTLASVYCHCYSTCRVEALNWVTSAFCPKTTEFWKRYRQRVIYVTLQFNTDSLSELYSEIMQQIGIPVSDTLKRRWKSADGKRTNEKAWNKSIDKKRRKLQLDLHTAHLRSQEKTESARLTKERALKSLEYSQGDIYNPPSITAGQQPTSSPAPSLLPTPSSSTAPTQTSPPAQARKKDLQVQTWKDVLKQVRTIGIAQSEGGKKFGRNELRERLSQYISDPKKFQHFLGKRKNNVKAKENEGDKAATPVGQSTINMTVS